MAFLRQCLFEVRQHAGEDFLSDGPSMSLGDAPWHLGCHPPTVSVHDELAVQMAGSGDSAMLQAPDKH
jgi:hypothetical protein